VWLVVLGGEVPAHHLAAEPFPAPAPADADRLLFRGGLERAGPHRHFGDGGRAGLALVGLVNLLLAEGGRGEGDPPQRQRKADDTTAGACPFAAHGPLACVSWFS